MNNKPKVLFLCTGNSCRSQMAEGWARHLLGDRIEAYSAGTIAQGLNPNAVAVMEEAGVDISAHQSKTLESLSQVPLDYVVTVCDNAHQNCPTFHGATQVIHHRFDDPPALAESAATPEEAMDQYRRVCGEIKSWVELAMVRRLGLG